jgi:formylglycine-generating enzyme required for sulfatase activity
VKRRAWLILLAGCGASSPSADEPVIAVAIEQACSGDDCPNAPEPLPEPREGVPPDMVEVDAGRFVMGCNAGEPMCPSTSEPRIDVRIDAFVIDRTEVTVARYRRCVEGGACSEADADGDCTRDRGDDFPISCVSWHQASAFCAWEGKRLPTEAEWESAARGYDARPFPWGDAAASCELAVWAENGVLGCGTHAPFPVGSKPGGASPFGALDMAGNLWEWTADWFEDGHASMTTVNPGGPQSGDQRVVKGGSWDDVYGADVLASFWRSSNPPDSRGGHLGFRCAMR